MRIYAPAKVNLCLRVIGKRSDGYHNIESVFYQVNLFDTLFIEPREKLEFVCDSRDIGPPESNLVVKAAELLRLETGTTAGARLRLEKKIPAGAGLGGGSSDAAAALKGLNAFWRLGLPVHRLHELAERLGSDVPFFIHGPAARVGGRGEVVEPFIPPEPLHLLLVKPECSVPTAWAYRSLDLTNKGTDYKLACFGIADLATDRMPEAFHNDFEAVVIARFPVIGEIKSRLLELGAMGAVMSGSGSAVAGIFSSNAEAEKAADGFGGWWHAVVETLAQKPRPGL
ncbi:MAG: 4-(cytidine 5'-diphospho)-2-C-methyl-D-erythritol kinase [Nitrospirae bacterium]|nr:4-(cytidine 5'-diphospho)-2-C-methyl-D-erythritol kinase [Nitrospirota bacterium]